MNGRPVKTTVTAIQNHFASQVGEALVESRIEGQVRLSTPKASSLGKVVYVNTYGGAGMWQLIKNGTYPPHHAWGCMELARMGYEVVLAEPLPDFNPRRPFPHDLKFWKLIRNWLGPDDILYCGHNVLHWIPLLKKLGVIKCKVVSLLFAREPLAFAKAHDGIIGLNPVAAHHGREMAPSAKVECLGWGVDLTFFPEIEYSPQAFLSCGKTHRDHKTLSQSSHLFEGAIRVISPSLPSQLSWSPKVELITGGRFDDTVTYGELLQNYYAGCSASLIILENDPPQNTAIGFTNLIEAMAMARPVIVTRTGAIPSEIDVEAEGCGIFVPPNDAAALGKAMQFIANNPGQAAAMGRAGRRLCEARYNICRYAEDLHRFFQSL